MNMARILEFNICYKGVVRVGLSHAYLDATAQNDICKHSFEDVTIAISQGWGEWRGLER